MFSQKKNFYENLSGLTIIHNDKDARKFNILYNCCQQLILIEKSYEIISLKDQSIFSRNFDITSNFKSILREIYETVTNFEQYKDDEEEVLDTAEKKESSRGRIDTFPKMKTKKTSLSSKFFTIYSYINK